MLRGFFVCCVALLAALLCMPVEAGKRVGGPEMCSGHGELYMDDVDCECHGCYQSSDPSADPSGQCDFLDQSCTVDASAGNPLLFQEYWYKHAANHPWSIEVVPWYRTGYDMPTDRNGLHTEIREALVQLHKQVGNVARGLDEYTLVYGNGCTGLLSAAQYAARMYYERAAAAAGRGKRGSKGSSPLQVFSESPCYSGYPDGGSFLKNTQWTYDADLQDADILEFVTVPNNPTGEVTRTGVYNTSLKVHDMVYYWPSLVQNLTAMDEDVMFFSLSKMSGMAGTRFGWGLVRTEDSPELVQFAADMQTFIEMTSVGISVDDQYRALTTIQNVVSSLGTNYDFFESIKASMASRWSKLLAVLSHAQARFSIDSVPGSFYAYVQCLDAIEAADCAAVFSAALIEGESGLAFDPAGQNFVRLELVMHDDEFQNLMTKISVLVGQKKYF
jgi:hypothetical protein